MVSMKKDNGAENRKRATEKFEFENTNRKV
jgi:hypothetical protein